MKTKYKKRFISNPVLYLQYVIANIFANAANEIDHFLNDSKNQRDMMLTIMLLLTIAALSAGAYYRIFRRQEIEFRLKWAADLSPIVLTAFLWVFGLSGCGYVSDPSGAPKPGTYFYHPDHLGSISMLTDYQGNKVTQVLYKPYGETYELSGEDIFHYKYTGQEEDNTTGLYYYNARFYDPAIGRFISPDTMIPDPTGTQDFNRYMYVKGNPIRYNDPSGHYPDEWWYNYYNWYNSSYNSGNNPSDDYSSSSYGYNNLDLPQEAQDLLNDQQNIINDIAYEGLLNDYAGYDGNNNTPSDVDTIIGNSEGDMEESNEIAYGSNPGTIYESWTSETTNNYNNTGSLNDLFPAGTNSQITSGFGYRPNPNTGVQQFHPGTDIWAPLGTPVFSLTQGRVIQVENRSPRRGYGNFVIVTYGNIDVLYGHFLDTNVVQGQQVNVGQQLGRLGESGNATGPHVHVEIHINGVLTNPQIYFRRDN